jgi:hypothetical protein
MGNPLDNIYYARLYYYIYSLDDAKLRNTGNVKITTYTVNFFCFAIWSWLTAPAVAHKLAGPAQPWNNVARPSTHNGRLNHTAFFTNHWGLLLWLFQMSYQCSSQVDYDVDPHLLLLIRKRVLQRLPSLSSFDFGRYEEV